MPANIHRRTQYLYSREAFVPSLFVQSEPELIATGKIPIQTWGVARPRLSLI